jgi:hypothetical protein
MTSGGDMLLIWLFRIVADQKPDISPGFILVQSIERVTCTNAGLTTRARIEIDLKAELFSRIGLPIWN